MDDRNTYPIWGAAARRDPHRLYARIRAEAPLYRAIGPVSGNTFWFFTRYHDCVTLLKDARFIKESDRVLTDEQRQRFGAATPAQMALNRHMLNLDPPDHTRLRALVHKAFTPRMIEDLRGRTDTIATALLDAIAASGDTTFDLIDRFAAPLPLIVIAELLGIPKDDRDQFRRWTRDLLFSSDPEASARSALEAVMYFQALFQQRRADPGDDLLSALLTVHEQGDHLDEMELLSMIFLLLVAGHETTVNLIANGMLTLFQHPNQKALLIERPHLTRSAVEEMLRYHGPVENTLSRWAAEAVEWDGHTIERGEIVMATLMAANRDPAVFPDPDAFLIEREPNRHLAFGAGIHFCLGAPLARLEGEIAFTQLMTRLPNLALAAAPDDLVWNDQIVIRGLRALPVRLTR